MIATKTLNKNRTQVANLLETSLLPSLSKLKLDTINISIGKAMVFPVIIYKYKS